jgi:AraC-like DNA-binding protein
VDIHTLTVRRQTFQNANKSNKTYVSHCFKAVWVQQGEAVWNIAGHRSYIRRNDVVLLNNEEKRRLEEIGVKEDLIFLVIELEPRYLYDVGLLALFTQRSLGYAHRIIHADSTLAELLQKIDQEEQSRRAYNKVMIAAHVTELLTRIARKESVAPAQATRIPPWMGAVLAYIEHAYDRKITLAELAAIAHMNTSAFSKAFTKANGIGPSQYLKHKRIGHAISRLEETDLTVVAIAVDCGYSNIANFYKAFHSLTGQTPSDYRSGQNTRV